MAKNEIFSEVDVAVVRSPLVMAHGLTTEGGKSSMQQFDISTGTWLPDWTKAWVVIRPWLDVIDPDGLTPSGNKEYTNPHWFLTENGVESEIVSGSDFTITTTGEGIGTLVVKRNASATSPMTLRFEGEYVDAIRGEVRKIIDTIPLICESTTSLPVLTLDQPETFWFDPVRTSSREIIVKASLKAGGMEVDAANREFVWEMKRHDGSWSAPGTEVTDEDVDISADGTEAHIHLDLIGYRLELRCRAKYDAYGNPSAVTLDAGAPAASMVIVRRMRKVMPVGLMPKRISRGRTSVPAEAIINDGLGNIPNPEEHFLIQWYTATGQANGSLTYGSTPVATGAKVNIPTAAVAQAYGGKVRVGVADRGPLKYLTIDGKVLTLGGKKLMVKAN